MVPAPFIIGLSGKMGVGKSTVAKALSALLPHSCRIAFGDMLKGEVSRIFNIPLRDCYESKYKGIPFTKDRQRQGMAHEMTVRELLQWYGTDVIRKKDPGHWCDLLRKKVQNVARGGACFILIDDVRFPNEAAFVKEMKGIMVRLKPFPEYQATGNATSHESETALDTYTDWDLCIQSNTACMILNTVRSLSQKNRDH